MLGVGGKLRGKKAWKLRLRLLHRFKSGFCLLMIVSCDLESSVSSWYQKGDILRVLFSLINVNVPYVYNWKLYSIFRDTLGSVASQE